MDKYNRVARIFNSQYVALKYLNQFSMALAHLFLPALMTINTAPASACISDIKKNEAIAAYYQTLRTHCNEDSCCLASVQAMEKGGFEEAKDGECPEGVSKNMMKCITSLKWCEKPTQIVTDCLEPSKE